MEPLNCFEHILTHSLISQSYSNVQSSLVSSKSKTGEESVQVNSQTYFKIEWFLMVNGQKLYHARSYHGTAK